MRLNEDDTRQCQKGQKFSRETSLLLVVLGRPHGLYSGPSQAGGAGGGGALAPQFLAKELTLSQPGGHIIPTTVLQVPPDFQTLRQTCYYTAGAVALLCCCSMVAV